MGYAVEWFVSKYMAITSHSPGNSSHLSYNELTKRIDVECSKVPDYFPSLVGIAVRCGYGRQSSPCPRSS